MGRWRARRRLRPASSSRGLSYSHLSDFTGSTRAARIAGRSEAVTAARIIRPIDPPTAEENGGDGDAEGEREEHNHRESGRSGQVSKSVAEVLVEDVQG